MPTLDWFTVTFDEQIVVLCAAPPGREPWTQQFTWNSIIRVCFKAEDLYQSDGIYIFTRQRAESYAIPSEAIGGTEFWGEILRRKLFDSKLAIEAAMSFNKLYCWPPQDVPTPSPIKIGQPAAVIGYAPAPPVNPTQRKVGLSIIAVVLLFMGFSLIWNFIAAVNRGRFTAYESLPYIIGIVLMIALWRGSRIGRWLIFAIYALAGGWLVFYSIKSRMLYFTLTGSILILMAALLALPHVGVFQRQQRRGRT